MALVAEFEITCDALPLVAVGKRIPAATIDVEMIPAGDGPRSFVAHVRHDDPAAVEDAFESAAFVGEYTLVGGVDGTYRYKIRPGSDMDAQLGDAIDDLEGLQALATTESLIDRIRVTPTGWIQSGRFADRAAFDAFRAFWQDPGNGDGFALRRLSRTDGADGGAVGGAGSGANLTDRQREAVATACEMGYFEIPRTASLDDVAADLGISASSLSERLRRAQTKLAETHVSDSARGRRSRVAEESRT